MAANSYDRAEFIMNGVTRSRKEDNGVHPAFFLDNGPIIPPVQLPSLDPTLVKEEETIRKGTQARSRLLGVQQASAQASLHQTMP